MSESTHKAGFVSIVGKPNAGKSTLMNQLVGDKLSIITSKAQTTRNRIKGIINDENYQIVYSDTPGIMDPSYEMHKSMLRFVYTAFEDADILLFVVVPGDKLEEGVIERLKTIKTPVLLIINKKDLFQEDVLAATAKEWEAIVKPFKTIVISALKGEGIDGILDNVLELLPHHPPYFSKDSYTDKSERFFASEIIREKIFLHYKKEVPYSSHVEIVEFKEEDKIIRMRAEIHVERRSQRAIIIGKGGEMLKKVGTEARKDLEDFFQKKVFLETYVRVSEDWRKSEFKLKNFGFQE